MEKKIIITGDGSHTIAIPAMNATYHSIHGALQESRHVFIEAGLYRSGWYRSGRSNSHASSNGLNRPDRSDGPGLTLLEIGFGTGLNALLTLIETNKQQLRVHYTAIELFPLETNEIFSLNYCEQLNRNDLQSVFEQLHRSEWEKDIVLTPFFTLYKINSNLLNLSAGKTHQLFDLVYFDAFAPSAQPELWTKQVFQQLFDMMAETGLLVTYCSKGNVRRAMQEAGFMVEKLPGPPGKREMLRAEKKHA